MSRPTGWLLLLVIFSFSLATNHAQAGGPPQGADPLYSGFLDPPRDYSPMPFWFWNGKMEGPKIQEEIRNMVDQHVYGACLHASDSL